MMREKILESALRVYTSKPPQNVTIKSIAREANVSTGLIFYYFKSKDDLERELALFFIERHLNFEFQSLEDFVSKSLKAIIENPGVYRFLHYVFEKEKYRGNSELALKIYRMSIEKLRSIIGKLNVVDVEKTATILLAIIDGLALYHYFLGLNVTEYSSLIVKVINCLRGE